MKAGEGGTGVLKMEMEELSYHHIKTFHNQHKEVCVHKLINLHTILLLRENKFQISDWGETESENGIPLVCLLSLHKIPLKN